MARFGVGPFFSRSGSDRVDIRPRSNHDQLQGGITPRLDRKSVSSLVRS